MPDHALGSVESFSAGSVRVVRVAGERLGVVLHEGQFYAFEDRCTHDDGPLGEGTLEGCEIECPRHGARFDIRTGRVTAPPAYGPLDTYPARVEDGQVVVTLPD